MLLLLFTHCDCSEQSLGHVGDDDADEEDDGVEPGVAQNEGNNEEGHAEEDRDRGDDVDEVCDLACYWRLANLQATSQVGNTTHHCAISSVDHQTSSRACRQQQRTCFTALI